MEEEDGKAKQLAKEGAKKATKEGAKKAGNFLIKTFGLKAILIGGLVILAIFLIIGFFSFFTSMPEMIVGNIKDAINGMFTDIASFFVGSSAKITPEQVDSAATYMEEMGYDLKGYGFAKEINRDEEGNIKNLDSKYLTAYLTADLRTYSKTGWNVADAFTNIFDWSTWGTR